MKVTQKRISVLHLSKQTEYNYDEVKKLVGQGLLYIRIKVGFEFVVNENHASNSDSELLQVGAQETSTVPSNFNGTSGIVPGTSDGTSGIVPGTSNATSGIVLDTSDGNSGIVPGNSNDSSGIVPNVSNGTSGIIPSTSNGNSGIVPHSLADNPGISALYNSHVQQEEEQKTKRPYDFFSRVVNEFPEVIMEPTRCLDICRRKLFLEDH